MLETLTIGSSLSVLRHDQCNDGPQRSGEHAVAHSHEYHSDVGRQRWSNETDAAVTNQGDDASRQHEVNVQPNPIDDKAKDGRGKG